MEDYTGQIDNTVAGDYTGGAPADTTPVADTPVYTPPAATTQTPAPAATTDMFAGINQYMNGFGGGESSGAFSGAQMLTASNKIDYANSLMPAATTPPPDTGVFGSASKLVTSISDMLSSASADTKTNLLGGMLAGMFNYSMNKQKADAATISATASKTTADSTAALANLKLQQAAQASQGIIQSNMGKSIVPPKFNPSVFANHNGA